MSDLVDLDAERKKRRTRLLLLSSKKFPYGERCADCAWEADEKTRTIACRKCLRKIEPFDCVLEVAKRSEDYVRDIQHLQFELETLRSNEQELRKVVDSLKGMERRLLKDWRAIVGQVADHLERLEKTRVRAELVPVVEHMVRMIRDWRPEDVALSSVTQEPTKEEKKNR
jgi:hypothetical protein